MNNVVWGIGPRCQRLLLPAVADCARFDLLVRRVPFSSQLRAYPVPTWMKQRKFVKKDELYCLKRKLELIKKTGGRIIIKTIYGAICLAHSAFHGFITWGAARYVTKSPQQLALLRMAGDKLIEPPSRWRIQYG